MKRRGALLRVVRVVLLALVGAGGLVGMLLADGGWDTLFFALTALPLMVGGWRAYALRKAHPKKLRSLPERSS